MQLKEAFDIIKKAKNEGLESEGEVTLCCGFTPLHFQTFLSAQFIQTRQKCFDFRTGLYGSLIETLCQLSNSPPQRLVVVIEWSDLDPRLGFRTSHGWRYNLLDDILQVVASRLKTLATHLAKLRGESEVVLSLPTLSLPPLFPSPTFRGTEYQFKVKKQLWEFAEEVSRLPGIVLVNLDRLEICSPMSARYDLTSDLRSGYPYSLNHTSRLVNEIVQLLFPPPRKKGIITDLDNTLWSGILGEDGVHDVSWELEEGNHVFALYQEMLASLQDLGVLIGVASKNDPEMVNQALKRKDLVIDSNRIFPVEAHWREKSGSIGQILKSWNIGADSVVFIDDSPMELAEVERAFPEIECLLFPGKDGSAFLEFMNMLRDRFGKEEVSVEDSLRVKSLQDQPLLETEVSEDSDGFLKSLQGRIRITVNQPDKRTLELINKTNQFNLNGQRLEYASWQNRLKNPESFVWSIYYQDKFGPLGQIGVVSGTRFSNGGLLVDIWVMSCRAFSRRIEHHILSRLLEESPDGTVCFNYRPTERNEPLRDFLLAINGNRGDDKNIHHSIVRNVFSTNCPPLCHKVNIQ